MAKKKKAKKKRAKKKTPKKKKKALSKSKKATRPKRNGRPKQYRAEYADKVYEITKPSDFTARALGKKFKVNPQTILNWAKAHPKFAEAIEGAIRIAVGDVQGNMFRIATSIKASEAGPAVRAADRILKSHMPEIYGDKLKHDLTGLSLADIAAIMSGKERK